MRSPQNTATTTLARSGLVPGRLVGAAAIAFAVSVAIEDALFAVTGARSYGDPIKEVLAYYAANRDAVAIVSGLVALYLPLLLVFVTGLHGLVERRGRVRAGGGAPVPAAAARVRDGPARPRGAARRSGRRLVAPRLGRWRDAVGHLRACQRPADRARALRRRARRADARVRARLAGSRGGVRAGAADARHHLHRRGPRRARERADSGLAAPAGPGGREPAARRGGRQPRDRRRLGAALRRAPRVRRLARLAARDRRAPRPVVTEMRAAPRSRTRARTPWSRSGPERRTARRGVSEALGGPAPSDSERPRRAVRVQG